jgi:hypothetical protein
MRQPGSTRRRANASHAHDAVVVHELARIRRPHARRVRVRGAPGLDDRDPRARDWDRGESIPPTIHTTARLPASLGGVSALGLSPTCSQSYDTLNQNRAYTDAANDVYQVTREVGQEAGGECESKMQPSANPLGGWCHVDAMKYWTQDETKMAVLPPMRRAADAALPEDERGTVIWLDEDFITKSPTSWLPMLGSEFILKGIMPIYIPGPCVNEADVNGVLGYYGAGCKTEENFASCKFTRHGADE